MCTTYIKQREKKRISSLLYRFNIGINYLKNLNLETTDKIQHFSESLQIINEKVELDIMGAIFFVNEPGKNLNNSAKVLM